MACRISFTVLQAAHKNYCNQLSVIPALRQKRLRAGIIRAPAQASLAKIKTLLKKGTKMSYSNLDDLKKKIDEGVLIKLTDTSNTGAINTAMVDRAIRDADAIINSVISRVYKTPLSPVPNAIIAISATLAISYLHAFRSVDSPVWSEAQKRALAFLANIDKGEATLEGVVAEPAASDNSTAEFTSADRKFSRDLLKGM